MKHFLLKDVRLSTYFWVFFTLFLGLSYWIKGVTLDAGALTLFSVNSFLYGFYISPILGAQKTRIDQLHQIIRGEANVLFALVLSLKKLSPDVHKKIQAMIVAYIHAKLRHRGINGGEKEYEYLISYCVDYTGKDKDKVDAVLAGVVANQQHRTNFNMQAGSRVFTNEWHIIFILFSITLGFVLLIQTQDILVLHVVRALLCTGLTMLVLNLIKLSTLTHKKADQMWDPLKKLVQTNFYRID